MNDEKLSNLLRRKFDEPLLSTERFFVLKITQAVIVHLVITREFLSETEQVIASFDQIQV